MAGLDGMTAAQVAALYGVRDALTALENALIAEGEAWPDEYEGPAGVLWGTVDRSIQGLTRDLKAIDDRLLDYPEEREERARR